MKMCPCYIFYMYDLYHGCKVCPSPGVGCYRGCRCSDGCCDSCVYFRDDDGEGYCVLGLDAEYFSSPLLIF